MYIHTLLYIISFLRCNSSTTEEYHSVFSVHDVHQRKSKIPQTKLFNQGKGKKPTGIADLAKNLSKFIKTQTKKIGSNHSSVRREDKTSKSEIEAVKQVSGKQYAITKDIEMVEDYKKNCDDYTDCGDDKQQNLYSNTNNAIELRTKYTTDHKTVLEDKTKYNESLETNRLSSGSIEDNALVDVIQKDPKNKDKPAKMSKEKIVETKEQNLLSFYEAKITEASVFLELKLLETLVQIKERYLELIDDINISINKPQKRECILFIAAVTLSISEERMKLSPWLLRSILERYNTKLTKNTEYIVYCDKNSIDAKLYKTSTDNTLTYEYTFYDNGVKHILINDENKQTALEDYEHIKNDASLEYDGCVGIDDVEMSYKILEDHDTEEIFEDYDDVHAAPNSSFEGCETLDDIEPPFELMVNDSSEDVQLTRTTFEKAYMQNLYGNVNDSVKRINKQSTTLDQCFRGSEIESEPENVTNKQEGQLSDTKRAKTVEKKNDREDKDNAISQRMSKIPKPITNTGYLSSENLSDAQANCKRQVPIKPPRRSRINSNESTISLDDSQYPQSDRSISVQQNKDQKPSTLTQNSSAAIKLKSCLKKQPDVTTKNAALTNKIKKVVFVNEKTEQSAPIAPLSQKNIPHNTNNPILRRVEGNAADKTGIKSPSNNRDCTRKPDLQTPVDQKTHAFLKAHKTETVTKPEPDFHIPHHNASSTQQNSEHKSSTEAQICNKKEMQNETKDSEVFNQTIGMQKPKTIYDAENDLDIEYIQFLNCPKNLDPEDILKAKVAPVKHVNPSNPHDCDESVSLLNTEEYSFLENMEIGDIEYKVPLEYRRKYIYELKDGSVLVLHKDKITKINTIPSKSENGSKIAQNQVLCEIATEDEECCMIEGKAYKSNQHNRSNANHFGVSKSIGTDCKDAKPTKSPKVSQNLQKIDTLITKYKPTRQSSKVCDDKFIGIINDLVFAKDPLPCKKDDKDEKTKGKCFIPLKMNSAVAKKADYTKKRMVEFEKEREYQRKIREAKMLTHKINLKKKQFSHVKPNSKLAEMINNGRSQMKLRNKQKSPQQTI